ncbi:MAG TPA: hypothetical protein DDZ51_28690 [Planctomycetaceae bacterium]|nr:hypothetical protein [Planctomycetaceae bacterium]
MSNEFLHTRAKALGEDVFVVAALCGEAKVLSEKQLQILKLVQQMPETFILRVQDLLCKELPALRSQYFTSGAIWIKPTAVAIPPLKDCTDSWCFVAGDFLHNEDDGFICLIRNGTHFCLCEEEEVPNQYAVDDTGVFESLFAQHHVVEVFQK